MYLAWVSRKSWKRHLVQTFGVIGHKELEETFGTKFWSNWSQRAQVNSYSALFVNNSLSARQMLTTVYAIKNHWIYLSLPKCRKFFRKKVLNTKFWMCCDVLAFLRKRLPGNICWINKVQRFFYGFLKNFHLTKAFYLKISYSYCCKYRFYVSNFLFLNIHLTIHFVQTLSMGTGLLFYTLVESWTR